MATTSVVSVPVMGLTAPPKSVGSREYLASVIKKAWTKYGTFFKNASETSKLPVPLLMSWAFVESSFSPTANAGYPIEGSKYKSTAGMMQWDRRKGYADAVLTREFKLGRMSEAEKEVLKRKGVKWTAEGVFSPITEAQALDPELNILIGSIYLGQYADSITGKGQQPAFATENGVLRIDRMIPLYNTGEGSKDSLNAISKKFKTALETANNASRPVTSDYIHKILGKNGTMDVMTKELKDLIK